MVALSIRLGYYVRTMMTFSRHEIEIFTGKITPEDLARLAQKRFGDMVKGVIDVSDGTVALGAELHADEESCLLELGRLQENLWGFNIYVDGIFPDTIEFDSMINIRPTQANRSRFVEGEAIRAQILQLLEAKLNG